MKKGRLEAFSDGVIAIIITIMVLELKVPHSADVQALQESIPIFLSYLLSFIYIGIYWNNHHHMLYLVNKINGKILWANLALLFFLSLVPFVTAWVGETYAAKWPVICYGIILIMAAVSYTYLAVLLKNNEGQGSKIAHAFGKDWKGRLSIIIYLVGIATAFWLPAAGMAFYVLVAIIWFIPDTRVEKHLTDSE